MNRTLDQYLLIAASAPDEDLGAFLRGKGLHKVQQEQWRETILSGFKQRPSRRSKKSPEARRIRDLEKELNRKEKALAETTALLVLQKKSQALSILTHISKSQILKFY